MADTDKKVCVNCGAAFEPTCHVTRQKFCTDACRIQYHNAKRYYDAAPNICPNCGEKIEFGGQKGNRRRFCNDRCRQAYHDKKRHDAKRTAAEAQAQRVCPHCGKEFHADWQPGKQQRFCCDACRIAWWNAYHKANPSEKSRCCAHCGREFEHSKRSGETYCSRSCYLQAIAETHDARRCQWCGEVFPCYARDERKYCCKACAGAARKARARAPKGSKLITTRSPKVWHFWRTKQGAA
jgi:hypothetical protein